ncbi:MAG: GMC family oxidoreductase [Pseudomonadota bacterium]|nr:GMC family oxidoreductase [Pseudomonadota bacterium]
MTGGPMGEIDAVIVGAGAGGLAAAWRLVQGGAKVLVLEAGAGFDPLEDYGLDLPDWETHGFPEPPGSRWPYVAISAEKAQSGAGLESWSKVFGAIAPGPRRRTFGYSHVRGVGGSTLHFTGEAHRMHPDAFQMASRFGVAADWPVSYAELEPFYVEAERQIGVAGPADPGARWRSEPFPLPAHARSYASQVLGRGAAALGLGWQENSLAVLSAPYNGRPPCNYCGNCLRGCPLGDKGSADVAFAADALRRGGIALLTRCQVVRLETGSGDRITGVVFADSKGTVHAARGRTIILAGGAIQTPRLLLMSANAGSPNGIANESGQVGRNFMETLFWSSVGLHPDPIGSHRGHPSDSIVWDFNAPDALDGTVGGFRISPGTAEAGFLGPIAYAERAVPGWGAGHKQAMRDTFGRALGLGAIGEYLPNAQSYVDLDSEETDSMGLPLPRIRSAPGDVDIARLHVMATTVRAMLETSGVTELIEEFGSWDSISASHVFGTCRMGADPDHAVVDSHGRSFRWKNLYIADASVFPSSGGGESPSLTIQALALRTADRILAGH